MSVNELNALLADRQAIEKLYLEQGEVQQIQEQIKKLIAELTAQTAENLSEQKELNAMFTQYDQVYAQNMDLTTKNAAFKQQAAHISALVSKEKVVAALSKRALEVDDKSRQTEKQILKSELDLKSGLSAYLKSRSEFHYNEILKVKVMQS